MVPHWSQKVKGLFMIKKNKSVHLRMDTESYKWLAEQAEAKKISKNAVIQLLINKAMAEKPSEQKKEA